MERDEIKSIMSEVLHEELGDLFVDRRIHLLDHEHIRHCRDEHVVLEKRLNHDFISSVRQGSKLAKKTTIRVAASSLLVFISYAVWYYVKAMFNK